MPQLLEADRREVRRLQREYIEDLESGHRRAAPGNQSGRAAHSGARGLWSDQLHGPLHEALPPAAAGNSSEEPAREHSDHGHP